MNFRALDEGVRSSCAWSSPSTLSVWLLSSSRLCRKLSASDGFCPPRLKVTGVALLLPQPLLLLLTLVMVLLLLFVGVLVLVLVLVSMSRTSFCFVLV